MNRRYFLKAIGAALAGAALSPLSVQASPAKVAAFFKSRTMSIDEMGNKVIWHETTIHVTSGNADEYRQLAIPKLKAGDFRRSQMFQLSYDRRRLDVRIEDIQIANCHR